MEQDDKVRLPRKLYKIGEVAEILGLSTRTVRRLIDDGEMTRSRLRSRTIRVHPVDLERYIDFQRGR